jgi:DNA-binding beta-propeller fold protein YncE
MRRRSLAALAPAIVACAGVAAVAKPRVLQARVADLDQFPPDFELAGGALGGAKPASATAAYLTGSRIAAVEDGALVIDADSGQLLRTDAQGDPIAQLAIGHNAGLLAYDPVAKLAYVADRNGNRVAIVRVGKTLELAGAIATPVEPFGIALSPDRNTVLVTTIADRTLVAYDVAKRAERWRTPLGREPRGLAVSPDGTRALVAYLATGTVDQVDLQRAHDAEHIALAMGPIRKRSNGTGELFARAAFAVTFMGEHEAVVPFQRETPVQIAGGGGERTGSYGGGFEPPIQHELAFLAFDGERTQQVVAQVATHQPHALAWDGGHDALYVAGLGSDTIVQVRTASQITVSAGLTAVVSSGQRACGPDGLAITPQGNVLVWCAFTRNVERIEFMDVSGGFASQTKMNAGPTLVASALADQQHEGMVLFHRSESAISARGALACASCHPDGRADGLSWRIDKNELQTPLLAGRLVGTHPFKWDGGDKDLRTSLATTMKRLGGLGLDVAKTDALAAYLEALPAPRAPTRDVAAVARGKQLFDSESLGCRSCHDGAQYTDQARHKFPGSTLPDADTPSLVGLAASAPYFHDGSATTLEALLRDRGAVHGMAETSKLSDREVADLTAFLETL